MHFNNALLLASAAVATAKTIRIDVGKDGLTFGPGDSKAVAGDLLEFRFHPKAHSVVQAAFHKPCEPLAGGFASGFVTTEAADAGLSTFTVTVKDDAPLWFYSGQGDVCKKGMVGSVNAPATGNTLTAFVELAKAANCTVNPTSVPCGGKLEIKKGGTTSVIAPVKPTTTTSCLSSAVAVKPTTLTSCLSSSVVGKPTTSCLSSGVAGQPSSVVGKPTTPCPTSGVAGVPTSVSGKPPGVTSVPPSSVSGKPPGGTSSVPPTSVSGKPPGGTSSAPPTSVSGKPPGGTSVPPSSVSGKPPGATSVSPSSVSGKPPGGTSSAPTSVSGKPPGGTSSTNVPGKPTTVAPGQPTGVPGKPTSGTSTRPSSVSGRPSSVSGKPSSVSGKPSSVSGKPTTTGSATSKPSVPVTNGAAQLGAGVFAAVVAVAML